MARTKPADLLRKAADDDTVEVGIAHDHGDGDAHHSHRLGNIEHTHDEAGRAVFTDRNGIGHVDDGRPIRTEAQMDAALARRNGSDHPVDATIAQVVTDLAALAEQRRLAELLVYENDMVVGFAGDLAKMAAQMADRRPVDPDLIRGLKSRLDAWGLFRGLAKPNGDGS